MARKNIGVLLDEHDPGTHSVARCLMAALEQEFQFTVLAAGNEPAVPPFELLLDFRPAGAASPAAGAASTLRYLTAAASAAGPEALLGARSFIVDRHTAAAQQADIFPALRPMARGVDFSIFNVQAHRTGALRLGWVGDAGAPGKAELALLAEALGDAYQISVISGQSSPQMLAAFYNSIDVLIVLSDLELAAQQLLEAAACGAFALCLSPVVLPACIAGHLGGLVLAPSAPALRAGLNWCGQQVEHIRVAGMRNAQRVAMEHNWALLAPAWSALLHREMAQCPPQAAAAPLDLLILDDIFPLLTSAFRIAEYNCYLSHFERAAVHSTATSFPPHRQQEGMGPARQEYETRYPEHAGKVRLGDPRWLEPARVAYMVFINNAYTFCPALERAGTPFIFCLYPGGGFAIDGEESDRKLRRVLSSPCFRKVLCTQKITYDYLIRKQFCRAEQIEFVYGGVNSVPETYPAPKLKFPAQKAQFDICFSAYQYSPQGIDKGYDVFVAVAKLLHARHADMVFHVIGNFTPDVIDVSELGRSIVFHGSLHTEALHQLYRSMDILLSPNRPFILSPGSFDGFPTGAALEAGVNEVALFVSDPLQLNPFADGTDLVIVQPEPHSIVQQIAAYYRDPGALYALSAQGAASLRRVLNLDTQMAPRLSLLEHAISAS
ncbi:glycosyltransferase family 4 protein [Pseudoduganella aquatica]|uniref:Glycosyltransferase n=1 Tax=Pseudoduganella aquatica TaxID=2660641 RepID=A0A7X4HEG6_9BURK|nr:glycosyltransferase family 4 protein [Pseudoduganella aquatica]MYN09719.1 hypothetical protein [Pseudoduganella aquatica]